MTETVEERLKRITEYVDLAMNVNSMPLLNLSDLHWLIARSQLAQDLEGFSDKYVALLKVYWGENERLRKALTRIKINDCSHLCAGIASRALRQSK